jgi:hypothetical protein
LHQEAKQTGVDKHEEKNTDAGHPKKITELRIYFNFGVKFSLTIIILIKTKLIMVFKTAFILSFSFVEP